MAAADRVRDRPRYVDRTAGESELELFKSDRAGGETALYTDIGDPHLAVLQQRGSYAPGDVRAALLLDAQRERAPISYLYAVGAIRTLQQRAPGRA